jgi:hypothetical protein
VLIQVCHELLPSEVIAPDVLFNKDETIKNAIAFKDRMEKEGLAKYVGKTEDGTFGFAESYVNYLMHYAFEAGEKNREYSFNSATKSMKDALDKVKDALDDAGWIDYNDNW